MDERPEEDKRGWLIGAEAAIAGAISGFVGGLLAPRVVRVFAWNEGSVLVVHAVIGAITMLVLMRVFALLDKR